MSRLDCEPIIESTEPTNTPDTIRHGTRSGLSKFLLLLAIVAAGEGCATAPRCRTEFIHKGEQASYLARQGCKHTGKLTYECCGDQAKDYDPWAKKWDR